ncbi:MAG: hypothetical protein H3C29_16415 [Simplicispira suum]|uniref:hypothetical protein n=1 Tax=Simplicispira suum TaxID=2109915 RepID=UPI001C6CEE8E|nr:hypothetical protein [Simplicispira suum]MBW7834785.1 hypothetical protein [Simplicispira suum]
MVQTRQRNTTRHGTHGRSADAQGLNRTSLLRHTPISQACGSRASARTLEASFAMEKPHALRATAPRHY